MRGPLAMDLVATLALEQPQGRGVRSRVISPVCNSASRQVSKVTNRVLVSAENAAL